MKPVWIASFAIAASTTALAQSTIYKHVDESGHITYTNRPMKGAVAMELEPLTTIPGTPAGRLGATKPVTPVADKPAPADAAAVVEAAVTGDSPKPEGAKPQPPVAVVKPVSQRTSLAAVAPQVQKRRDDERRRILMEELAREEESLTAARSSLTREQQNPELVAAVRAAQQATQPTPTQLAEFRDNIEKASGRIRGLQATVAEHQKNIEALKKELGALKP